MIIHTTLVGMAVAGQTITKNTSVSILLVVMLVGATITITNLATKMTNDIENLKSDVAEIKIQQTVVYDYITTKSQ